MAIKIAILKNGMQILGDFSEDMTDVGAWIVKEPVNPVPSQGGLMFYPILGFCEENRMKISFEDMLNDGEPFVANLDIANLYSEEFGSGIQIVRG